MKLHETFVATGGVYRCCLESIGTELVNKELELGDKCKCVFCGEEFTLVLDKGEPTWLSNIHLELDKRNPDTYAPK